MLGTDLSEKNVELHRWPTFVKEFAPCKLFLFFLERNFLHAKQIQLWWNQGPFWLCSASSFPIPKGGRDKGLD